MIADDPRTAALLRAAVHAEAGPPDPALAGRLLEGADRKGRVRRLRLVAGAAAATVVVAGGGWAAMAWTGSDQDGLIAGPGSDQPTPSEPPPSQAPSGAPPSQAPSDAPGEPAVLPETYVVATQAQLRREGTDGSGGTVLAEYDGAPAAESEEPAGSTLAGVDVTPDGTVYADVCCEPAAGRTEQIPPGGAQPDRAFVSGFAPAVSPDGQTLAAISLDSLVLVDTATGRFDRSLPPRDDGPVIGVDALAWSPDGTLLAMQETPHSETGAASRIRLLDPRTATTREGAVFEAPPGLSYAAPAFRGDGMLVVARQEQEESSRAPATGVVLDPRDGRVVSEFPLAGRVLDQDYDQTGTYLLTVYADGTVGWKGGGRDGSLAAEDAVAAAW